MAENSTESEKKTADDMAFRNNVVGAIQGLYSDTTRLKAAYVKRAKEEVKTKREAATKVKVAGLGKLNTEMGQLGGK
jgi:hypothetical protein